MIKNLTMNEGLDVWINKQLEERIVTEFKNVLESDNINYYAIPCFCDRNCNTDNKIKWFGSMRLKHFIKTIQNRDYHFSAIGVTNSKNKSQLEFYFENEFLSSESSVKDYWIGDVVNKQMVCGDDMVILLWDRLRDRVTTKNDRGCGTK